MQMYFSNLIKVEEEVTQEDYSKPLLAFGNFSILVEILNTIIYKHRVSDVPASRHFRLCYGQKFVTEMLTRHVFGS